MRKRFIFSGRVQGVGFRAFCRGAAVARRVDGWVKNRPDGTVEMEAQGAPEVLAALEADIRDARPPARIDRVESFDVTPRDDAEAGFKITF